MCKKRIAMILTAALMIMGVSMPRAALAEEGVKRNTTFTSMEEMQKKLGTSESGVWSPAYLTEVENTYWTFADQKDPAGKEISLDMAKNCYRNLEMLLDNGYTMDYDVLSSYCKEYLGKRNGEPDAFYNIMTGCLKNPYLINRPEAKVTATTYNGRDYSKVFDASYYYSSNPDVAKSIGDDPPELLRHFVEIGITEGRAGNKTFDVKEYKKTVDENVKEAMLKSALYASLGDNAAEPVGQYSYSYANYYGKYLGHYVTGEDTNGTAEGGSADPAGDSAEAKTVAGTYTTQSTKSVYTNETVSRELANARPIAVMMPTDKAAQPSFGIGNAEILYEIMEEGSISRQMAIIPDWQGIDRIGNLRSCRKYYIYAAKEWDPILIHFGGVVYMKGFIDAADVNNLSGTYEYGVGGKAPGAGYFFRSSDRSAPHNAYISAAGIKKAARQQGYSLNLRSSYYNPVHFKFAQGINDLSKYADATDAEEIDLSRVFPYSRTRLVYNEKEGRYYKEIHGGPQKDAVTGEQLSFANVIIQNTKWKTMDEKGYLDFTMIDSTEDGYYFTKGKRIHIHWKKDTDYSPTKYYDDSGNEIEMNTGRTYIAIAQEGKYK